jgi:hypothetical protein
MKWVPGRLIHGVNMRSINENLRNRLVAEAEEAKTQGLIKIAENLTRQIERNEVRPNDARYTYSNEAFVNDVETALWDVVVRASDFHGAHLDAAVAHKIVVNAAQNMVHDIRTVLGVKHGVGAHEPGVPGETKEIVTISVEDDE